MQLHFGQLNLLPSFFLSFFYKNNTVCSLDMYSLASLTGCSVFTSRISWPDASLWEAGGLVSMVSFGQESIGLMPLEAGTAAEPKSSISNFAAKGCHA